MRLSCKPIAGSRDAGLEVGDQPKEIVRVRNASTIVLQFQGLTLRALDADDRSRPEPDVAPSAADAGISRLQSAARTRPLNSILSAPPSPFVLFLL